MNWGFVKREDGKRETQSDRRSRVIHRFTLHPSPFTFHVSRFLIALALFAAALHAAEPSASSEKKVIYYGWNTRDSAYVRAHWQEMERMPFDGIAISIALDRALPTVGNGSTGNLLGWNIFGPTAFSPDAFRAAIADLQQPAWTHFTDNFLPLAIASRDQDHGLSWFDEARWAVIENNWRVLLTIAREGGCRGLMLDPEQYDYECELFNYQHHRAQRDDRPFADYTARARERGRQLGAAMRELFPDITICLLYGYTLPARELRRGQNPETGRYALMPAFLDGLIESSAPGAKFADLWEFGHRYKKAEQFLTARNEIQIPKPASGQTQRAVVTAGMSLRIDYGLPRARWQTENPERNYFSPIRFKQALRGALEASDRYVWIYSEDGPQFFPMKRLPWPYVRAMRKARRVEGTSLVPWSVGLTGMLALGIWHPMRRRSDTARPGAMRILLVTGIFPPDRGGPASYVPKMAAALTRRGHGVEVVCLSDSLDADDSGYGFPVWRIRRGQFWPRRIWLTVLTVWRAARRHDLVYVNGLGSESALAAALAGRPAVHKIVGDYAWERAVGRGWFRGTIDEYQTAAKTPALRFLDCVRTFPLKLAHRIIVPSRYLRRIVSGWDIAAEKIRVIPNATAAAPPEAASPLDSWPGRTLITVCRLVPWKGIDALIRLLPELPETRLVIAGDGQLRAELDALAQSEGVAARVVFLGDVPHGAVAGYFAQADAFVLNSTYEGLPHVVLEAMSAGVPVIATDAGGTGEVVEDNVTGLLVPVGDATALEGAIQRLASEPELGPRLAAEASRRLREHFDFDAMICATEAALRFSRATGVSPLRSGVTPVAENAATPGDRSVAPPPR